MFLTWKMNSKPNFVFVSEEKHFIENYSARLLIFLFEKKSKRTPGRNLSSSAFLHCFSYILEGFFILSFPSTSFLFFFSTSSFCFVLCCSFTVDTDKTEPRMSVLFVSLTKFTKSFGLLFVLYVFCWKFFI